MKGRKVEKEKYTRLYMIEREARHIKERSQQFEQLWPKLVIRTVLHHLKIELPTAYSTEAEPSDTSVASMLHHDLLNCEEPVTVWSPSTKSTVS